MFLAILKKEMLLTLRDVHALAVLFAMPIAFILVMSLAMQNSDIGHKKRFNVVVDYQNKEDLKADDISRLNTSKEFHFWTKTTESHIATLHIPTGFFAAITKETTTAIKPMEISFRATTPTPLRKLLVASLRQDLIGIELENYLAKQFKDPSMRNGVRERFLAKDLIVIKQENQQDGFIRPTSVQQSVPAWLIFSMFFVVIPIATTLLIEKQNGTHQRLMTLPVNTLYLLSGKLVPYLMIIVIQTVLMFLVGVYLVPLLGGQGLILPANVWPLLPVSLAVGLAAISMALLIASIVKSTEQASSIGGLINVLLAAVGGIMVPTYIMPDFMQRLAAFSPMNWDLQAYLSILLGENDTAVIYTCIGKLLFLSIILFTFAMANYRRSETGRV